MEEKHVVTEKEHINVIKHLDKCIRIYRNKYYDYNYNNIYINRFKVYLINVVIEWQTLKASKYL